MASPSSGAPPEQEAVTTQEKARSSCFDTPVVPRSPPAHRRPMSPAQLIEEKEERLQRLLDMNRAKLASMEADLVVLRRDMKLTSQPKKAALEMLRLRIEEASERVRTARSTRNAAAAALAAAESRLAAEEAGASPSGECCDTPACLHYPISLHREAAAREGHAHAHPPEHRGPDEGS